ncbi:nucleotide-binding universal stress UspA family protein [Actinoplanes octamycinicus]|uniref:Nucleotide-binding universal stress UspA family protein n=1 Tax=Actinoplanes octamycinicus TaxID=135948 RepID=A0A7W7H2S1_9ACTN|nr:universal stress protein [Actinoplanes octamycinicus]MBB4742925.1 nucleotide-binding universal stress UspA family protein [Actinoplanes octamycinicus]GIE58223.1 hypothetical protein Aoc01nite_36250 [Actinoplanes octamycinicus]
MNETDLGGSNRFNDMINRAAQPVPAARRPASAAAGGLVLAGVDDSPISSVAADHAAIEAGLHGWALRLLTVRRTADDDAGETVLRRLAERVRANYPEVPVTSRFAVGAHPARLLLAEGADADLLVVGHRHGTTITALGRSVADRVVRGHRGPVLVVRMPGWPVGPGFGTRPLVVAVDGSPPASVAMDFAYAEARARGCQVVALHIVGERMDLARRLETRQGVAVRHRILAGDPLAALVEESGRAAAVVVGRVPRDLFARTALDSAARVLPQRALCPVFVVG